MNNYTQIIPTRYGNMVSMKCDQHISAALALYGEATQIEVDVCLDFIRPGDVVLDVGANIGYFTMAFARRVGKEGCVISFEPQRLPYLCLCANIAINSMAEYVQPVRSAVGAEKGMAKIEVVNSWAQVQNVGGTRLNAPSEVMDDVPVAKIDDLALPEVDFIKIDVEGMEQFVLAGAVETIKRCRPVIFSESLYQDEENRAKQVEFFRAHDYAARLLHSPLFSSNNCRGNSHNIFGQQADVNIVAIPNEMPKPEWFANLIEL